MEFLSFNEKQREVVGLKLLWENPSKPEAHSSMGLRNLFFQPI